MTGSAMMRFMSNRNSLRESLGIIRALAEGVHPVTGEYLNKDHFIKHPSVRGPILHVLDILLIAIGGDADPPQIEAPTGPFKLNQSEAECYKFKLNQSEAECYKALRAWRNEMERTRKLPANAILDNLTLNHIAKQQPQTHVELIRIHGIGPAKLSQYGDDIL